MSGWPLGLRIGSPCASTWVGTSVTTTAIINSTITHLLIIGSLSHGASVVNAGVLLQVHALNGSELQTKTSIRR